MATPTWQPMPDTSELTIPEAAEVRTLHRALMAVRWRDPEARAEDQAAGLLPRRWHEWMLCAGFDEKKERFFGYEGPRCTCNDWVKPERRKGQRYPEKPAYAEREAIPHYFLLVKTIDMSKSIPILVPKHENIPKTFMASELDPLPSLLPKRRRYRRRNTKKLFSSQPSYFGGRRRTMSQLRRDGN